MKTQKEIKRFNKEHVFSFHSIEWGDYYISDNETQYSEYSEYTLVLTYKGSKLLIDGFSINKINPDEGCIYIINYIDDVNKMIAFEKAIAQRIDAGECGTYKCYAYEWEQVDFTPIKRA